MRSHLPLDVDAHPEIDTGMQVFPQTQISIDTQIAPISSVRANEPRPISDDQRIWVPFVSRTPIICDVSLYLVVYDIAAGNVHDSVDFRTRGSAQYPRIFRASVAIGAHVPVLKSF